MKNILILGSGCAKCDDLYIQTEQIANELGIEFTIKKITNMLEFINYGVMITPALVIDGKLKIAGKVPSAEQIKSFLSES